MGDEPKAAGSRNLEMFFLWWGDGGGEWALSFTLQEQNVPALLPWAFVPDMASIAQITPCNGAESKGNMFAVAEENAICNAPLKENGAEF